MRIALGYDSHRLKEGGGLMVGGIFIACPLAVDGAHSDGDTLLHALADALLSPLAMDIGTLFPNTDAQYKNMPSRLFVQRAAELLAAQYRIVNVDMLIIADEPKIAPHSEAIRQNIALLLGVAPSLLSLRGKTTEGASPRLMQAFCSALFGKLPPSQ